MYDKICKHCGWALSKYYATGMLGCPDCYKAFNSEITSTLYKIQGKTFHVGKSPYDTTSSDRELIAEYNRLLSEREQATLEGRFDDIRPLSQQILEISRELKDRGIL